MPFLPLHDANPRLYIRAHYVTIGLILLNAAIFWNTLGSTTAGLDESLIGYALIPARLFGEAHLPIDFPGASPTLTLVSYQFLHGGWQHLIFNMLFLWVFGDNIEDALGHLRFIAFFLICGVAGGLFHSMIDPRSLTPTIGASGAIAGVLGGYLMLYPRARLLVLAFGFIPMRLPALLVIGAFFAQDLLWGITGTAAVQGVAVWAHIGGFITGVVLVIILKRAHIPLWHRPPGPWN
jgi:membrane associated rhomboid family serine protease